MRHLIIFFLCFGASLLLSQPESLVGTYSWLPERPPAPAFENTSIPDRTWNFTIRPNLTMYVDVESYARARVLTSIENDNFENRILTRAFDADERIVHWQYQDLLETNPVDNIVYHPKDPYVDNLLKLDLDDVGTPSILSDAEFALVGEGIHQIRVTNRHTARCQIALSEDLLYGVSFQNGIFSHWTGCPNELFFIVPPKASIVNFRVGSGDLTLQRVTGGEVVTLTKNVVNVIDVVPGEVWRLGGTGTAFNFAAYEMPLILCESVNAAEAIQASVYESNGVMYQHKIQEKLYEAMPDLLDPSIVGDASDIIIDDLTPFETEWLVEPLKNRNLITIDRPIFSKPLFDSLSNQNINSNDHWAGTWHSNPTGSWNNYSVNENMGGQIGPTARIPFALGFIATLDEPFNPYSEHKEELLHRATASCFLNLQKIQESECFPRYFDSSYPGHAAFTLGEQTLPNYGRVSPEMPDTIREVWTEAIRHLVDRHLCDILTSTRNQSAHFLVAFEYFAKASRDTTYKNISRRFARIFAASQSPAGWYEEAYGPCGSYNGITNFIMSKYYRMTGDIVIRNSIEKVYDFFNHSVAPEPDNRTLLGGYNFNHRIGQGFFAEQWGGAKDLGRSLLGPGIHGARTQEEIDTLTALAIERIEDRLEMNGLLDKDPGQWSAAYYDYYLPNSNTGYIWPAHRQPFSKMFSSDMLAVKTSSYYINIFTGAPAWNVSQVASQESVREPQPYEKDPNHGFDGYLVAPLLGGGLSTFWTPDYGTSLMATNWSPDFHNGLVATVETPNQEDFTTLRYFEDYLASSFTWDPAKMELHMMGEITDQNITYDREIVFRDCYLDCSVNIPLFKRKLSSLYEIIPLVRGERKRDSVMFEESIDLLFPNLNRTSYTVQDTFDNGVKILFDGLESLDHIQGMGDAGLSYNIDQLRVNLPNLGNYDSLNFGYHLIPFNALTQSQAGLWKWMNTTRDESGHELHGTSDSHLYDHWNNDEKCPHIELKAKSQPLETVPFEHNRNGLTFSIWVNIEDSSPQFPLVTKMNGFSLDFTQSNVGPSLPKRYLNFNLMSNNLEHKLTAEVPYLETYENGGWHHYVVTYDAVSGEMKVFIDGQLSADKVIQPIGLIDEGNTPLLFGSDLNDVAKFIGLLGESRYFTTALTENSVNEIYHQKSPCYHNVFPAPNLTNTESFSNSLDIVVSPNPARESVTITSNISMTQVQIYSIEGTMVHDIDVKSDKKLLIDVRGLTKGTYLVRCETDTGPITKKLLLVD